MIWSGGVIDPDDALAVSVADRTFEHGLGLFETLRTWVGRPSLLGRHKARMLRSAEALGLLVDPQTWPDEAAVRMLLDAEGFDGDRMLRVTATGGTASGRSVVWMRSSPLPPPIRDGGAVVCINASASPFPLGEGDGNAPSDFTARHKTLNYWFKRVAHERARALGYDETLIHLDPWGLAEGSRSNLFLVIDGRLVTPSTVAPIVPGILRGLTIEAAEALAIETLEVAALAQNQLEAASEIFLTNAVRGIIPVARVDTPDSSIVRPAPGPVTIRLQLEIDRRLHLAPKVVP